MADSKEESKKRGEIKPDEIIDRLVTDPDNPNVKRVVGLFLGKSSREILAPLPQLNLE